MNFLWVEFLLCSSTFMCCFHKGLKKIPAKKRRDDDMLVNKMWGWINKEVMIYYGAWWHDYVHVWRQNKRKWHDTCNCWFASWVTEIWCKCDKVLWCISHTTVQCVCGRSSEPTTFWSVMWPNYTNQRKKEWRYMNFGCDISCLSCI